MNEIKVVGLSKSYGEHIVLNQLSFCLKQGRVLALMGPSGVGKTTLLRILCGLELPSDGRVEIPEGTRLSAVFQENRLIESLTVSMNLKAVLGRRKTEEQTVLLNALGLSDVQNAPVRTLSGGMKRRVALARALLFPSDFLLLDEPFKGLDVLTKDSVMRACQPYFEDRFVLLVTHDESEAAFFDADRLNL